MKPSYPRIALALLLASLALPAGAETGKPQEVALTILGTTDLHGNVYPTTYFDDKDQELGLAKVATLVKQYRKANPNTLLVDSGDALQGSQLVYVANKFASKQPNPMMTCMNKLGYAAFAMGNHEFNFGLPNLTKARTEAYFPFLSANILIHGTNQPAFEPYTIKKVGGVRVGIIAFTPPGVALWDKANVQGKLDFADIEKSAARYLPELKKKSDVVVALAHSGLGGAYGATFEGYSASTGLPPENVGETLAKRFPIDVLLLGHTHEDKPQLMIGNAVVAQAKKWGERLAVVQLKLEKQGTGWKVVEKNSQTLSMKGVRPDPEVMKAIAPLHRQTVLYVHSPIAKSAEVWTSKTSDLEDTPIVDLINEIQRKATKADLSAASIFNSELTLPKGNVSISEIAALYPYENTLMAIRITGKQLRAYLENSARYYNSYQPGTPAINPQWRAYNYDMVSGVDYQLDLSKPEGSRVTKLSFKGKPVQDGQTFTMAINSYRQRGGGGYEMIKDAPVVYNKEEGIRETIIDFLKKKMAIKPSEVFKQNWQILGDIDPEKRLFK